MTIQEAIRCAIASDIGKWAKIRRPSWDTATYLESDGLFLYEFDNRKKDVKAYLCIAELLAYDWEVVR